MDALIAYISSSPVGPLIVMAVIVVVVLIVKAVFKVQRNPDGYVSVPDDEAEDEPAGENDGKDDADVSNEDRPDSEQ